MTERKKKFNILIVGQAGRLAAEETVALNVPEGFQATLFADDDLNTHVSTSGYKSIHTPTLDKLAAESMTFRRAFCQYPVCGPSRASFLSGLYPESTGVLNNTYDIRKERPGTVSMPQFFKHNGYWTASVGKVFHSPRHEHGKTAQVDKPADEREEAHDRPEN